jgi:hypothetical protein
MGISLAFLAVMFALAACAYAVALSLTKPISVRWRGLGLVGVVAAYLLLFVLLGQLHAFLLTAHLDRWGAFTFGITFGLLAVVVTGSTVLVLLVLALYLMIRGMMPGWLVSISKRSWGIRMGLGAGGVLLALGVAAVLSVVLGIPR